MCAPEAAGFQEFTIRSATNADTTAIRAVLLSVRQEYGVLSEIRANDPDLNDIEAGYLQVGGCFQVVEDAARRIIGCAGLLPLNRHRAELCKMYLEKPARGRGLGKQLLVNMVAAARRAGFREIWIETNSCLTEAITLYRKHGFEPVESGSLLPKCDQAYLLRLQND